MNNYKIMVEQVKSIAESSNHFIPLMANVSAILFENMDDINWAGFYIVRNDNLILGPFQGKVACVNIEKGKGVCGTAFNNDEIIVVDDVHKFEGHIACDSASNSEIVIPIHYKNNVIAVLDIDSPLLNRFKDNDKKGLCELVRTIEDIIYFEEI